MSTYINSSHTHEVTSDTGESHDTLYFGVDSEEVKIHTEDTPLMRMTWAQWQHLVSRMKRSHEDLAR